MGKGVEDFDLTFKVLFLLRVKEFYLVIGLDSVFLTSGSFCSDLNYGV